MYVLLPQCRRPNSSHCSALEDSSPAHEGRVHRHHFPRNVRTQRASCSEKWWSSPVAGERSCILVRRALCGWDDSWSRCPAIQPSFEILSFAVVPGGPLLLLRPSNPVNGGIIWERLFSLFEKGRCSGEMPRCAPLTEILETPLNSIWDPGRLFPISWNLVSPDESPVYLYRPLLGAETVHTRSGRLDKTSLWFPYFLTESEPLYTFGKNDRC